MTRPGTPGRAVSRRSLIEQPEDEVRSQRRPKARNRGRRSGSVFTRKMSKEQSEWLFAGIVFVGLMLAVIVGIKVIGGHSSTPTANRSAGSFFGGGGGGGGAGRSSAVLTAVAGALNISTTTLTSDLQAGQTVPQIAAAQNISIATVDSAYLSAAQQEFNSLASSGRFTQAQATQLYSQQQQDVDSGQFPLLQFFGGGAGAAATP